MASKPKEYEVTDAAGDYIAGRRVPKGGRLFLTDEEARFDLGAGNIRRYKEDQPEASDKDVASRRKPTPKDA